MDILDVKCPHCGYIQSDMHNGGDAGEWWHDKYIPEGYCETDCEECGEAFLVEVTWLTHLKGVFLDGSEPKDHQS